MKKSHGGDIQKFIREYGMEPLDFSTNLGQGEMPESVRKAVISAIDEIDRYPDPECGELRKKIAEHHNINKENIICGNGAADLIFRFVQAQKPKTALVAAPAFSEYEEALSAWGTEIAYYMLKEENEFRIQKDYLDLITEELDVIFLCEPGNPTGVTTDHQLLMDIVEKARQKNVMVFLDECFNEFLEAPDRHSLMDQISRWKNLVILKSFTKLYRMPGARLGYAVTSNEELLENMGYVGQSWPVSTFASAMGAAYLMETDYTAKAIGDLHSQREMVKGQLESMGFKVIPGQANYLLFKAFAGLGDELAKRGIMIRSCGNYAGLDDSWFRVGIRDRESNNKLIEAIGNVKES